MKEKGTLQTEDFRTLYHKEYRKTLSPGERCLYDGAFALVQSSFLLRLWDLDGRHGVHRNIHKAMGYLFQMLPSPKECEIVATAFVLIWGPLSKQPNFEKFRQKVRFLVLKRMQEFQELKKIHRRKELEKWSESITMDYSSNRRKEEEQRCCTNS